MPEHSKSGPENVNRPDRPDLQAASTAGQDEVPSSNNSLETQGLSLKVVQAFLALASERSFTKAARELHLTQSGLSRIIGGLENEVGEHLFSRATQSVLLTPAGEALIPHALRLAQCYQQALNFAGQPIRTSALLACSSMLVSDLLRHLPQAGSGQARQNPRVHTMGSHKVLDAVRSGAADLGVCVIGVVPDDLCIEVLYRAPIGLLARPGVPLPHRVDNPTDLGSLTYARLSDEMVLPGHLRRMGVELPTYFNASVVCDSMTGLMSAIRSSACVSLVSEVAAHHTLANDLVFKPIPNSLPKMHLCIAYRRTGELPSVQPHHPHRSAEVIDAQTDLVLTARGAVLKLADELKRRASSSSSPS